MIDIKEILHKKRDDYIKNGLAHLKGQEKPPFCEICKKEKIELPFIRWGYVLDDIFTWGCAQEHPLLPTIYKSKDVYPQQYKKLTDYEVVVQTFNGVCYISEDEKRYYIERKQAGDDIVIIRDYVFDRVYPMMPTEEYEEQQRKKDIRAGID